MVFVALRKWPASVLLLLALTIAPVTIAADPPPSPLQTLVAMTRTALTNAGLEQRSVETPRGTLTWFEGGSGRTIVLVHGTNDQAGSWAAAAKALVPSWNVVIPDLPGHGDSAPRDAPITCGLLAGGLEAVIDAAAPNDSVVIVGNSMGGWLALLFALDHPDRVDGLVLEDAGGLLVAPEERIDLIPKTRDEARAVMTRVQGPIAGFLPDAILDDIVEQTKSSPLTRMDVSSFEKCLLDGRLEKLRVPAVVLWGSIDGVLPPDYGRTLAGEIPDGSFTLLDGCGHIPHLHCAGVMVPRLLESLEQLKSRGAGRKLTRSGRSAAR